MRRPKSHGSVRFRNFPFMIGVVAECWRPQAGKASVLRVNGHVWLMLRLNITGVELKSSASKAFATDQRIASCTKWVSREPFRIKIADLVMIRGGWMTYVRKTAAMKSELKLQNERLTVKVLGTFTKGHVLSGRNIQEK